MTQEFATLGIGNSESLVFEGLVSTHHCQDAADLPGFLDQLQNQSHTPVTFAIGYEGSCASALGLAYHGQVAQACVWESAKTLNNSALLDYLPTPSGTTNLRVDTPRAEYDAGFAQVIEYIRSGDCYQANLTLRGSGEFAGNAQALYAALLARQWVPYHSFMPWAGGHAISLSPELLWKVDGTQIQCEPMKGTVASPQDPVEAEKLAKWLASDTKNRAENVMIVDLIRNDLGRIAQSGSVQVPVAFEVRQYTTVQQMVSRVEAVLATDRLSDWVDALIPFGSITGAPKRRAIEILQELESSPRGLYTGAMGYLHGEQSLCNVAIRTIEQQGSQFTLGVGGGLTIGSELEDEWREALLKTRYLGNDLVP